MKTSVCAGVFFFSTPLDLVARTCYNLCVVRRASPPRKRNQVASKLPKFVLTVTKAVEKEYSADAFRTFYRNGYNQPTGAMTTCLCLTGNDAEGKRFWVKLPKGVGLTSNGPTVAAGDTVLLQAKVKGQSDDGGITFLSHGKLLAVADDASAEADALLDEYGVATLAVLDYTSDEYGTHRT